jgi:adenylosuccinate synthase
MGNLVIVGTQWGDEGKGKIVDLLSSDADIIVRFQGGHNAGHTLVVGQQVFKLSLLPSGIIREHKTTVIGNGVVLDPWKLIEEITLLRSKGISIDSNRLRISENTPLILSFHSELDIFREKASGKEKIGTTGRGIGPAYEDKVGRRSLRAGDLRSVEDMKKRLKVLADHHNILRAGYKEPPVDQELVFQDLMKIRAEVIKYVNPVWEFLNNQIKVDKKILFEGAQGTMLDVDFGTYPFVTSSSTLAGAASLGSGVPHNKIQSVLGITKAYTTRVGKGPMPTELFDDVGQHLSLVGKEKGTVTGRDRRCGWFDAPLVKRSCIINGITGIALTKIDVLDQLEIIKICVGYRNKNDKFTDFPLLSSLAERIEPIYEEIPGWNSSTLGVTEIDQLPKAARDYIKRIEELIEAPIILISTGPERDETILLEDPFSKTLG